MEEGVRERVAGARRLGRGRMRPVDLGDPLAGPEVRHREPPERHHDRGIEDLELAPEVRRARRDLIGLGVAVARRAALHDVRDEHLLAAPAERREELHEEIAGPPDERPALLVLRLARVPRRRT